MQYASPRAHSSRAVRKAAILSGLAAFDVAYSPNYTETRRCLILQLITEVKQTSLGKLDLDLFTLIILRNHLAENALIAFTKAHEQQQNEHLNVPSSGVK